MNNRKHFSPSVDRPQSREHVRIAGVSFDNVSMNEAIARIDGFVREGVPRIVVTPNVDHVLRLRKDRAYARLVERADLVLVDSQPIVGLSRMLGRPLKERVAGSDLFPRLCEYCAQAGYSVFFMGGDPGTAERTAEMVRKRHPSLRVAGTHFPPFGFDRLPEENRRAVEKLRAAKPDVVFVGLGSPKQEKWIAEHKHEYGAPVSIGVGITFSFMSGEVKRAPLWMQKAGFEWLHRLITEPRRLWRRYLARGMGFIPLVIGEIWMTWRDRRRKPPMAMPTPPVVYEMNDSGCLEAADVLEQKASKPRGVEPVAAAHRDETTIAS